VKRLLLSLCLTLAAAFAAGGASAVSATSHPTLRLMDSSSVMLRGVGFKRHERVRVTVSTKVRAAKSVDATSAGSFVVTFAGLDVNACAGFVATAVGSDGSRATFKRVPGMCAQP
jgi:hypothetical protein